MKTAMIIYTIWCAALLGVGYSAYKKVTDISNPNSYASQMKKLQEINENP